MRLAQGLPGHPLLPSHRSGLKAARRSRERPPAPQRAGPQAARLGPRPVPRPGPGPAPPLSGSFPPPPQTSCSRGHPPWGRGSVTHLLALPTLWVVLRLGASLWLEPLSAFSSLNTPPGRLSAPPPRVPAPLGSLSPHTPDTALSTEADSCSLPIRPVTTRGQGALSQSHHGAAGPECERRSARATAGGADGETEAPRGKQGPDKLGLVTPAPHPAWTLEHRAGLGEAGGIRLQPPHSCTRGGSRFPEGAGPASTLRPAPCSSLVGRECGEVTLATPSIWRGRQHHGREPRPHGSLRTSVLPLLTLVLCSGKVLLPRCLLTAGHGHPESGTCSWESRGDLANWEVASPGPAPFLRLRASSGLPAAAQLLGGLPPAFLSLQGHPLGAPRLQGHDCSP